jgi:hypothetical protein
VDRDVVDLLTSRAAADSEEVAYLSQAAAVTAELRHQPDALAEQVVAVLQISAAATELLDLFARVASRVQA